MYDTVNGARLASKRLQGDLGLKASEAKRIVAVAAGCRDWHNLERTIGTPSFPSAPDEAELRARIARADPTLDADVAVEAIMPTASWPWSSLPDMPDMEEHAAAGMGRRTAGFPPLIQVAGDVTTATVTAYAVDSEERRAALAQYDEELDRLPPGTCIDNFEANVHDVRWELRRDGELVAIAAGTLYDADREIESDGLVGDVADSDMGNPATLDDIVLTDEITMHSDMFWGSLLVLNRLHVRRSHRHRGVATELCSAIGAHARRLARSPSELRIAIDLPSLRDLADLASEESRPAAPTRGGLDLDDHRALAERLLSGRMGEALREGGGSTFVYYEDPFAGLD